MNTYLTKCKVDLIKEAKQDFLDLYGVTVAPFTRKIYFYFITYNGLKYIHKKSLEFVYTNADTWTTEIDPYYCDLTKKTNPPPVIQFLENYIGNLLPKLVESNDKFLVYEYFEGDPVDRITAIEFYSLKEYFFEMELTPFYNSMTYNLVRANGQIKLVDLKHFEYKTELPFFIYLYNQENSVNTLYVEKGTHLGPVICHLAIDYPADCATIIEY